MNDSVKNESNTGIYLEHCEFRIGGKFYLINPSRVKTICYDDTPDKEKIIIDFNHPDNKLEYYCLDGLQLEWNRLIRDFVVFWKTNARDIDKLVADNNELDGLCDVNEQKLNYIKTGRKYYRGSNENERNDGKPRVYTKEEYKVKLQREKENEIKYYEKQKQYRKDIIEKEKNDGTCTQEEYENNLKWLEEKYSFLNDPEWQKNNDWLSKTKGVGDIIEY